MPVALLKQALPRLDDTHIERVPKWTRPSDVSRYWHIPRTAYYIGDSAYKNSRLIRVEFWCGVSRMAKLNEFNDTEPIDMRCGTCEGRYNGWTRSQGNIFSPRSDFDSPKKCPSDMTMGKRCIFCGAKPTFRRNYCHCDEVAHRPGELLSRFAPCPTHGWKYMRADGERLYCHGDWVGQRRKCEFISEKA